MSEIPAVLAPLAPAVVAVLEAEPGWAWIRCDACAELRYQRRTKAIAKCNLTPRCGGRMQTYLALDCQGCGRPVTARRRLADTRFCSNKCQEAA